MASPRCSSPSLPGMSSHVPPSFGQPGISISYRPKHLLLASHRAQRDASIQSPSQPCPTLSVTVPPASIHHIFNHRQWRAGMLMSDALVSGAFDIANKYVLELGAGTGLPSITAAKLGTSKLVVASDYDEPAIVSELKRNVGANLPKSDPKSQGIKVCGHIWGKNVDELLDCLPTPRLSLGAPRTGNAAAPKFDSILMADCLWDPLSHADLLKTLTSTLARTPDARVHVIAGLHTGREKITGFLRRAHRTGLGLAPIPSHTSAPLWPSLPDSAEVVGKTKVGDEALASAAERILELEEPSPFKFMAMSSMVLATAGSSRRLRSSFARMASTTLTTHCMSTARLGTATVLQRAHSHRPVASSNMPRLQARVPLRFNSTSSSGPVKASSSPAAAANRVQVPTDALAHYEGPLARTFTRLKLFSLCSLALASTFGPVLMLAPGEISMAGRVGLCLTALSTSGVSTALIAWIGQPYAGRMHLLAKGEKEAGPKIRIETVSWKLKSMVTTVYEPSFLRATSRPFATWELTNAPPPLAVSSNETNVAVTKVVSETVEAKTGKVVGRWIAKYDATTMTKTEDGWKMEGRCEVEGKPIRYLNVHEELLDDDWRVLG
ncbi:hypothetical protein ACQY0O_006758 [Thecaphora frezii]